MTSREVPPSGLALPLLGAVNSQAEAHYHGMVGPLEHPEAPECEPAIANVGWTLGNDCPYRCTHCYSMSARRLGANLESWMVDRVSGQLSQGRVETVNLGGNEPIFTNGLDVGNTLLPYIIRSLRSRAITVGLTTSGITLIHLNRFHSAELALLNDVDVSFDSPFPNEHNQNRGADLYGTAVTALTICEKMGINRTLIMTAMKWNFTRSHLDALLELARKHHAHIRINPLKPVEAAHMAMLPDASTFYAGFSYLMTECEQVDLGEPMLAAACGHPGHGCPCGRTSFRIHSITPEGRIPVSPCVYLHEYKVGDLLKDNLVDIIMSPSFRVFRRRNANPDRVAGCGGCSYLSTCRAGCAARSYLHHLHETGCRSLFVRDPYCLRERSMTMDCNTFPQQPRLAADVVLVHKDYLCTWIGRPLRAGPS
jgi:radical SAM protein with 4Fe4S-binding SPASM domain